MSDGIVGKDSVVDAHPSAPRTKSRVPFSNKIAGTYRFGEYQPHFCAEVVNADNFPVRSIHNVRSFNLKAPLLSDIQMKKDYFQVPNESILPLNWAKIYTPPVGGDDVNATSVNAYLPDFPSNLASFINTFKGINEIANFDPADDTTFAPALTAVLKLFVTAELFLSSGSLFETLGSHLHSLFSDGSNGDSYEHFDLLFDEVFGKFNTLVRNSIANGDIMFKDKNNNLDYISPERYLTYTNRESSNGRVVSFGWFMDSIRDDFDWSLFILNSSDLDPNVVCDIVDLVQYLNIIQIDTPAHYPEFGLNYSRESAYQLVCYHFYSNDKIDYVYSAELYRQLVYDAYKNACQLSGNDWYNDCFTYNGMDYRYDILSGYNVLCTLQEPVMYGNNDLDSFNSACQVLRLLFGFNRSLRYLDYFTGSKSNPLAVGDINVPVVGGYANAIDITKSIQKQRFFNFVNRVGRKFEEYTAKMNGTYVKPDWHDPLFLGHTQDVIYGAETENTNINPEGINQPAQSTISTLRSNASRFAFELEFDRPSIVIGITYFDIERFYSNVIERQNFHASRFDMFNKFMQYVGDQPVSRAELVCASDESTTFGYALRHMEYKTRVNQTFGGFSINQLPGWEFIADQASDMILNRSIGPDYIRSRSSELDPFFLSLTGFSRGTYWHFIVENNNVCEPVRPMVYAPEIL